MKLKSRLFLKVFPLYFLLVGILSSNFAQGHLKVGAGISDVTGPMTGVSLSGYGDIAQRVKGIHTRLKARAFVIEDQRSGRLVVFVIADLHSIPHLLRQRVLKKLQREFGKRFTEENVMITATHTHSGPGGASDSTLLNFTSLGFDRKGFVATSEGIYKAIRAAYLSRKAGSILFNRGELLGASVNRSRRAYLKNSDADVDKDTNKEMTLLKFVADDGEEKGLISWFPVHPTSMGNKNFLISADNKGHASTLFEREMKNDQRIQTPFVAAFANSEEGDASPNIFEPKAFSVPSPSIYETEKLHLSYQAKVKIIGEKQYLKAKELYLSAKDSLSGPIDFRHVWVKMPGYPIDPLFTGTEKEAFLCEGALGKAFAAGAADGKSDLPGFSAGMTVESSAPWIGLLIQKVLNTAILGKGTSKDQACHSPKPIFIAPGKVNWTPNILPFQLFRVDSLVIVGVPSELTTAAGKRLKEKILSQLSPLGVTHSVIAGLANSYSLYVTTPEEYAAQEYEGAATLFGPHTLGAYQQIFSELGESLLKNSPLPLESKLSPSELNLQQLPHYSSGVLIDHSGWNHYGDVLKPPKSHYLIKERIQVSFRSGDPRNDLQNEMSYIEIQKWADHQWQSISFDGDPDLIVRFEMDYRCLGCSKISLEWQAREAGIYRILHRGKYMTFWNRWKKNYVGVTPPFEVSSSNSQAL